MELSRVARSRQYASPEYFEENKSLFIQKGGPTYPILHHHHLIQTLKSNAPEIDPQLKNNINWLVNLPHR